MNIDDCVFKCDTCIFNSEHSPGNWQSVAEGYDDPYGYVYCSKGHWVGGAPDPNEEVPVDYEDPWKDCADYQNSPDRTHSGENTAKT